MILLLVLGADIRDVFASWFAVDLVLLVGGFGVGVYAASLFGLRWPNQPPMALDEKQFVRLNGRVFGPVVGLP